MTKPAATFTTTAVSPADLMSISDFLKQVAATKTTGAEAAAAVSAASAAPPSLH